MYEGGGPEDAEAWREVFEGVSQTLLTCHQG